MSEVTVTVKDAGRALEPILDAARLAAADRALLVRVGLAVLGRVRKAFLDKARGGADESGLRWPPLSPKTIAYSRRHLKVGRKGQKLKSYLPRQSARAAYAPSYALTQKERDAWWGLYKKYLGAFHGDKGHAAAAAWRVMKARGARTLLALYGGAQVEILRDTGLLYASLAPGAAPENAGESPPSVPNQVFRVSPPEVIVGTNREHAEKHHKGIPGRLPQRRLWPAPEDWPATWWEEVLEQARQGLVDVLVEQLEKV